MIKYNLTHSKRKTIAIHITKEATVEVKAPLNTPKAVIDKFVLSKEKWIIANLADRQARNEQKSEFTLNIGDMVLLQGKKYPIKTVPNNNVGFDGISFYVPANLSNKEIKYAVIQIYKMLAKNILTKKVVEYAKKMNVTPLAVKINSANTRWGSCSSKNSLNFSWKLILADETAIDYVVVHELAHIKEHNHSDSFWKIVASVFSDYKACEHQLKMLQEKMSKEDWE